LDFFEGLGLKLMLAYESSIEFHFINNDNEDSVKKIPIHMLKVSIHKVAMVIFMLNDPKKKQIISLIYLTNKISDELFLTSIKKGFRFK